MRTCLGCGVELVKRHQYSYCSNSCQMRKRQREYVDLWLATGVGAPAGSRNNYIRLYLFEQQDGRCAICGNLAEWLGQPLSLVIDHIDGDASNNHRENLRMVCPNCDSQLPTYKGRNRGKGRHWRAQRYADGKSY